MMPACCAVIHVIIFDFDQMQFSKQEWSVAP